MNNSVEYKIPEPELLRCPICGNIQEVSRDGWLVESYMRGKKEVKYTEWIHIIGHFQNQTKMCAGSGLSPHRK